GFFLGKLFFGLKNKAEIKVRDQISSQLELKVEGLKEQLSSQLNNFNTDLDLVKAEASTRLEKVETERDLLRKEKDFLSNELTRRNAEFEHLQQRNTDQKKEVEQLQEKFTMEFENLANRILDQKSEKFTLLNKENLQNIL